MQVFLNAEKRANPSSKLTLEKANLIAQICGQLEGMPLALELAARWRGALGLPEILSEIEQRNRLEFLTSDLEGIEERHKSLAKLASQSLNRLAKEEQRIFLGLCFMKGGFTRIAAEKISGASLENMISLLGKSFIQRDREGTFRIHEFLRQFGINQLENDKQRHLRIRDRYVAYYSHLMEKSWWEAWSGEIKTLKREWVNIGRAFLLAAESRNFEAVRRMMVPFSFSSVVGENFATSTILFGKVAEELRGKAKTEDEIRTWALVSTQEGYFAGTQGQFDRGIKALAEARSLLEERRESLEFAWLAIYEPLAEVGAEYERMRANVEKALVIFEKDEEPYAISVALNSLGNFAEGDKSIGFHKRALAINRAHNGTRDQAWSLIGIGIRQMIQGNLRRALENVNSATQKYTSIQYSTGMAWGHGTLGQIFQKSENLEGARRHYEKAIRIWRDGGWKYKGLGTVELLGTLDFLEGKYVNATAHFLEVTEKSLEMGGKQVPNWIVPAEECALLAKFGQTRLALIANRYTRKDLFAEEMWGGLDIQFEEFKQNISKEELDRINKEVRRISPYQIAFAISEALQDIQFQLSGDEKNLHV